MSDIIIREAEDKYKGFRYQKLRLAKVILKKINEGNKELRIIGAVEYKDDLYIEEKDSIILEQDKLYSKNFSFCSSEVYRSIINFLDQYLEMNKDENITFIFNTNVKIAKENQTKVLTELKIKVLKKDKVIELLKNKEFLESEEKNTEVINFVSNFIKAMYKEEYKTKKGYLEKIQTFSKQDWKNFLLRIEFNFEEENYEELDKSLNLEIKRNKDFLKNNSEEQLEIIKSRILEEIDKRMVEKSVLKKIIDSNLFKIIFLETNIKENLKRDPGYVIWDSIEDEKNDFRNLKEKIESVCKDFNKSGISKLSRDAISAEFELNNLNIECQKALKLRVFDSMGEYFDNNNLQEKYSEVELKQLISLLKEHAIEHLKDLKQDYDYSLKNEKIVAKCVALLINECYYSFD